MKMKRNNELSFLFFIYYTEVIYVYKVYQVQGGDTIEQIANLFHTNTDTIRKLNGITGNVMLRPGSFLIVPVEEESLFDTYIVQKGDNMYTLARTYNVDYDMLLELNGLDADDYIYPEQEILIPKRGVKMYRVKNGDTIESVSNNLNTDYTDLSKYNKNLFLMPDQILFYQ